jgi:hypothetical protein
MKTILKFRLVSGKEPNVLKLRPGYRVVRCEYVVPQKAVFLWVEQPLKVDLPELERRFLVTFSGEPVPTAYQYLDTALDPFGPEAYHVFEVIDEVRNKERDQPEHTAPASLSSHQMLSPPEIHSAGAA